MTPDPAVRVRPTFGPEIDRCTPNLCTLIGVPMDQHRPDCPLRAFEPDPDFGTEEENDE